MGTSFGGEGGLSVVRSVGATGFLRAAGLRERFTMPKFLGSTRLLARSKLREEPDRRWSL